MIKEIKNKQIIKKKNFKSHQNKFIKKFSRGNTFINPLIQELKSPSKIPIILGKRNNKTNSYSSSNQNKTERNTTRLKEKIEQKNNLEYIFDNKRLNNYLKNKNINQSKNSISKIDSNNLNKSNNNSKKIIDYH